MQNRKEGAPHEACVLVSAGGVDFCRPVWIPDSARSFWPSCRGSEPFPCQNEQDAHLKFSFSHAKQPLHFAPRSDKMKAVHMGA